MDILLKREVDIQPFETDTREFFDSAESSTDTPANSTPVTVTAGVTTANIDIILNGTDPRFDQFESARLLSVPVWRVNLFLWVREEGWRLPEPGETA